MGLAPAHQRWWGPRFPVPLASHSLQQGPSPGLLFPSLPPNSPSRRCPQVEASATTTDLEPQQPPSRNRPWSAGLPRAPAILTEASWGPLASTSAAPGPPAAASPCLGPAAAAGSRLRQIRGHLGAAATATTAEISGEARAAAISSARGQSTRKAPHSHWCLRVTAIPECCISLQLLWAPLVM